MLNKSMLYTIIILTSNIFRENVHIHKWQNLGNEKIKVNIILIQIIEGNDNLFVYTYLKQSKVFNIKYTLNERYK